MYILDQWLDHTVIKEEILWILTLSAEDLVSMMGVFMGEAAAAATGCVPDEPSPLPWRI